MGTLLWNLEHFDNFKLLFTTQSNLNLLETKSGRVQILGNVVHIAWKLRRALKQFLYALHSKVIQALVWNDIETFGSTRITLASILIQKMLSFLINTFTWYYLTLQIFITWSLKYTNIFKNIFVMILFFSLFTIHFREISEAPLIITWKNSDLSSDKFWFY